MNDSYKFKAQCLVPKADLTGWLRALAGGEPVLDGQPLPAEGFKSLKISLKDAGDAVKAKVSVKFAKPGEPDDLIEDDEQDFSGDEDSQTPKYKSLKKHMKHTFKVIGQALAAGVLPPELETVSFVSDARLMASYPGKGDPYYAQFVEQLEAFEEALVNQDLEAVRRAYQELDRLKKECHARYA